MPEISSPPSLPPGEPPPGASVLIVENYGPVAQVLSSALEGWFADIVVAGSLEEVTRLAEGREPFDVVICDHTLPDGSGHEVKRWLDERRAPGQRRAPTAYVLMAGSLPGFHRGAQAGMVLLPKPFTIGDLLGAIEEARRMAGG